MTESAVILRRLLRYLAPYKARVATAYIAMLAVTGLNLVAPAVLGWVVDVGLTPAAQRNASALGVSTVLPFRRQIESFALSADTSSFLIVAAAALVGLALVRSIFGFLQIYMGSWLSNQAAYDVRNDYFRHVQRSSFAFHDRTQTGDLMSRAVSDISGVQNFIGEGLIEAVNIPVLFFAVALVLFRIDAELAVIVLSPLIALAAITIRFGRLIEPRFKAVQDQEGVLSTRSQENFTGQRVIKAFAREDLEIERFADDNREYLRRRIRVISTFAEYFPLMAATVVMSMALLLWFGGQAVLAGTLTAGTLVSFNLWIVMLAGPTQELGFFVNRASEAVAGGRRFFEILDEPVDIADKPGALDLADVDGAVEFDQVSFSYGERQVLFDVSFRAEPNTMVALFGPTGSGKSSVVGLIPRFYDVDSGAVRLDGHDVRDITIESLRCHVGMVLQDTFLFSATIRDNIAYGRLDANQAAVAAAAKAAGADEFIDELPDGYDTIIGERGVNLSGGQRQRVAIARALLTQPRILILDDATSAVDTATEHRIQKALAELMRGRTTFVIAQRLLTLKNADQILVMQHGRIVERGTHTELVQGGGLYARIYDLQLKDQEAAAAAEPEAAAPAGPESAAPAEPESAS